MLALSAQDLGGVDSDYDSDPQKGGIHKMKKQVIVVCISTITAHVPFCSLMVVMTHLADLMTLHCTTGT